MDAKVEKLKFELDEAELGLELQSSKLAAWENTGEAQIHQKYRSDLEEVQARAEEAASRIKEEAKAISDTQIARVKEECNSRLAVLTEENARLELEVTDLMNTLNKVDDRTKYHGVLKEKNICYPHDAPQAIQSIYPSGQCVFTQTEVRQPGCVLHRIGL